MIANDAVLYLRPQVQIIDREEIKLYRKVHGDAVHVSRASKYYQNRKRIEGGVQRQLRAT